MADGVEHHLDPRSVTMGRILILIFAGMTALSASFWLLIVVLLRPDSLPIQLLIVAGIYLLALIMWRGGLRLVELEHKHTWYRISEHGIEIHEGVVWRSARLVARSRIQHTDVTQGPLQRRFGLASLTDWLDGYIARRRRQITWLGQMLDPIADKLLTSAAFISLVQLDLAPAWMVALIIGREFAVTGLRSLAYTKGITIPASPLGKIKMASQVTAILLLILGWRPVPWLAPIGRFALWVVMLAAVPGEQPVGVGQRDGGRGEQAPQMADRALRGGLGEAGAEGGCRERGCVQGAERGTVGLGAQVAAAQPAQPGAHGCGLTGSR